MELLRAGSGCCLGLAHAAPAATPTSQHSPIQRARALLGHAAVALLPQQWALHTHARVAEPSLQHICRSSSHASVRGASTLAVLRRSVAARNSVSLPAPALAATAAPPPAPAAVQAQHDVPHLLPSRAQQGEPALFAWFQQPASNTPEHSPSLPPPSRSRSKQQARLLPHPAHLTIPGLEEEEQRRAAQQQGKQGHTTRVQAQPHFKSKQKQPRLPANLSPLCTQVLAHIKASKLLLPGERVLVAVSGSHVSEREGIAVSTEWFVTKASWIGASSINRGGM